MTLIRAGNQDGTHFHLMKSYISNSKSGPKYRDLTSKWVHLYAISLSFIEQKPACGHCLPPPGPIREGGRGRLRMMVVTSLSKARGAFDDGKTGVFPVPTVPRET